MIAAQLNGGLGNQLFQYATARSLAKKFNAIPYLDLTLLLEPAATRPFYLDGFNIKAQNNINYFERLRFHNFKKNKLKVLTEEPSVKTLFPSDNLFLNGYWQNHEYFDDIKDLLIQEITPKKKIETTLGKQIKASASIGLHIRRGDYVNNPYHEICTETYFLNAIRFIREEVEYPVFYVFSDDISYCKTFLKDQNGFIFIEEENAIKAFCMLKDCKHFILSNSSFCWWAQYINTGNPLVVAPPRWFTGNGIDTSGIYFPHWKIIETA